MGDTRTFAVEFQVKLDSKLPPNEWWGSLWLWVEGNCVGNPHETEMFSIGLAHLVTVTRETGFRTSRFLSSVGAKEALDMVIWSVYGDEDPEMERLVRDQESLHKFDILPTSAGPFFDGWQATLIEEGEVERFIWRKEGDLVREARWKLGTFRRTVLDAKTEFDKLAASWRPN